MGKELAVRKPKLNALEAMASRLQVQPEVLKDTLMKTAFANCKSDADFMSGMIVANTYGLNPLLKEMYAFPSRNGGIIPIVSVDGWISLMQRHKDFNGIELTENDDETTGKLKSVTCKIYLKGKDHPVVITEYMEECDQAGKDTWKKWPRRMLRHKALIQGARVAFGFSGIYDEDEGERIKEAEILISAKPIVAMPKELSPANAVNIDKVIEVEGQQVGVSSEDVPDDLPPAATEKIITKRQRDELFALIKSVKISEMKLKEFISNQFDKSGTASLTEDELIEIIEWINDTAVKK